MKMIFNRDLSIEKNVAGNQFSKMRLGEEIRSLRLTPANGVSAMIARAVGD